MPNQSPTHNQHPEANGKTAGVHTVMQPRLTVLILLSALAVLPVNMIVPALPNIAATFQADFALVNLAVAGFAIITAFIEAAGGALSDRFGRRPIVLVALIIFLSASIGCTLSPSIGVFLFFRAIQACVAPCYSVALVIIKETSDDREVASKFGYLAMGWALAPMIGPLFGGVLTELFGWQSNFVVLAMLGASALALALCELKETSAPSSRSGGKYIASYGRLLSSARFWAYTLCMACSTGTFYVFLGGTPLAASELLGGSTAKLGFFMAATPVGFILGSFLAGRYGTKISLGATLVLARLLTCAGLLIGFFLSLSHPVNALAFFGPCVFIGIGNGLTMPAATTGVLSVYPDLVGTAAGLTAAMRLAGGATTAAIAGLFFTDSTRDLLVLLLASAAPALLTALYAALLDRRGAQKNSYPGGRGR